MGSGTLVSSSYTGQNGAGLDPLPAQPQARSPSKNGCSRYWGVFSYQLRESAAWTSWQWMWQVLIGRKVCLKQGRLEVMTVFSDKLGKQEPTFIWKANNFPVAPEAILSWFTSCFILKFPRNFIPREMHTIIRVIVSARDPKESPRIRLPNQNQTPFP